MPTTTERGEQRGGRESRRRGLPIHGSESAAVERGASRYTPVTETAKVLLVTVDVDANSNGAGPGVIQQFEDGESVDQPATVRFPPPSPEHRPLTRWVTPRTRLRWRGHTPALAPESCSDSRASGARAANRVRPFRARRRALSRQGVRRRRTAASAGRARFRPRATSRSSSAGGPGEARRAGRVSCGRERARRTCGRC